MSLQAVAVWILAFALVSVGVVDLKSRQPGEWKDFHHAYLLVVGNGHMSLLPAVPVSPRSMAVRQPDLNATRKYVLGQAAGLANAFLGVPIFATMAVPWMLTGDLVWSGVAFLPSTVLWNCINHAYLSHALADDIANFERQQEQDRFERQERLLQEEVLRAQQQRLWERHCGRFENHAQCSFPVY